jgi:hypothetical protein
LIFQLGLRLTAKYFHFCYIHLFLSYLGLEVISSSAIHLKRQIGFTILILVQGYIRIEKNILNATDNC